MSGERDLVRQAHVIAESLGERLRTIERLMNRVVAERDDALRRATEAEQNALHHEARANVWADAGLRLPTMQIAAEHLIEALDRLPLRMEDAGMKQMVTPPDIPLYGTHDWEAVEQAKRRLFALLPERKESDEVPVR